MAYKKSAEVDIKDKVLLTVSEAAALTGIGINKIDAMAKEPGCPFVLKNGGKKMIKKDLFLAYLMTRSEI